MVARVIGMREDRVNTLRYAGILHDVGKLGVPTKLLQKTGGLTEDEFAAIKLHPVRGLEMLSDIEFLDEAFKGILHHHERIDGTGYPMGLRGHADPGVRPGHRGGRRVRLDDVDAVLPRRARGRRGDRRAAAVQGHPVRPAHGRRAGPGAGQGAWVRTEVDADADEAALDAGRSRVLVDHDDPTLRRSRPRGDDGSAGAA